ncbi:MAG TPA: protein kinase [Thermoanaerobaculia bacterium]
MAISDEAPPERGNASEILWRPPLVAGTRLGRYEIRGLLGSGAMGKVYAAHDLTLDREVAIKALAVAFHGDPARLKRFQREARVLAALSHSNVAAIYGFEELDGAHYLVLEMVDGESLAQRLADGPLPWREAVALAAQVAEGLAEAHAKGVIHRDLKPSNVMLSRSGRVKLVDFGLAKSTAGRSAEDLTATGGSVVGTAPYMSPEQVRGDELDERTDVWAFGCLLYEMLAGCQAFRGRSVPEVLVAVLHDEPDFDLLPQGTPAPLCWLIQRCLRRDPATRPRHVADLGLELLELAAAEPAGSLSSSVTALIARRGRTRSRLRAALLAAAAAVAAVALAVLVLRPLPGRAAATAVALSLELPHGLAWSHRPAAPFAFAPDGSRLVLVAEEGGASSLYVRRLDDPTPAVLPGTEEAWQPFFSPDGTSVGFFADRKVARIPLTGGPAVPLGEFGNNARGAAWLDDGTIVLAPTLTSGLLRIGDGGGAPTPFTQLDAARGELSHRWPDALPGGRAVLLTVGFEGTSYDEARLDVVIVATGERRPLLTGASYARYAPSGHLVFASGGRLLAVGFDLATLTTRGTPHVVLDGVRYDPQNGGAHFALSPAGDLIYGPGLATSADTYLSWLHPDGRFERLAETARRFRDPRPAPDGSRVAVIVGTARDSDLRVIDAGGTSTQLSFGLSPHRPTWFPDGRRVTVSAESDGRWRLLTLPDDGSAVPQLLLEQPHRAYPCDWTPDGRTLVFQSSTPENGWDLQTLAVDERGRPLGPPRPFVATPFHETNAVVSPDGRWTAYESDELDSVFQVYARSFPDGDHKVRITNEGARWPSWSDGGTLAYWSTGSRRVHVVRTHERDGQLEVDAIRALLPAESPPLSRLVTSQSGGRFNAHPRDPRFLVLESSVTETSPPFSAPVLVTGWSRRLKAALGGR